MADKKNSDDEAENGSEVEETEESEGVSPETSASDDDVADNRDGAAERMAKALGVDGEADEGAEEDAESAEKPAPPPNRAQRRRDEIQTKRRKRRGEAEPEAVEAKDAPKDRNARARELLKRRREEATERAAPSGLDAGEMVDDALARMTASSGRWLRDNLTAIQVVVVVGVLATVGVVFYLDHAEEKLAEASSILSDAVAAERGRVLEEDKRSDEEKELDPVRVFATEDARSKAALDGYTRVLNEYPGTGAAILAKLGEAGVHLDQHEYDAALEGFANVLASPLAGADLDVKGRAIEGQGFAKEGKGDIDGALASFKELEGIEARGYKELALYHQARLLMTKGENDKAKELLKQAREKLQAPSPEGQPFQFLEAVVDEALRTVDPTAAPARPTLSGPKGNTLTPEEIQRILRQAQEGADKKANEHHDDE